MARMARETTLITIRDAPVWHQCITVSTISSSRNTREMPNIMMFKNAGSLWQQWWQLMAMIILPMQLQCVNVSTISSGKMLILRKSGCWWDEWRCYTQTLVVANLDLDHSDRWRWSHASRENFVACWAGDTLEGHRCGLHLSLPSRKIHLPPINPKLLRWSRIRRFWQYLYTMTKSHTSRFPSCKIHFPPIHVELLRWSWMC